MSSSTFRSAVSVGALALALGAFNAEAQADAQPAKTEVATPPPADGGSAQPAAADIIVTGFRSSLQKGLTLKREAVGVRDSIVAEDIGKFPEQNVADSLQRIPGVRLSRDGTSNEGQRISIRGLGSQYAVTTINMAPVHTTSSQNVGSSTRDFNYDVFPSELFGRVDVYKTPLANLEEGGIGGNVDLQTPRPFDSNKRILRYSLSANYNDQSAKIGPRGSLLYSNTWGNFGLLLGFAYAKNTNERSGFQSTGGYNSSTLGATSYNSPAPPTNTSGPFPFQLNLDSPLANFSGYTRDQVSNAYLPRFYRVYASSDVRTRIGAVGSLQYKSDRLEISLDGIFSKLKDSTDEYTFGVGVRNSRSVPGSTSAPGTGTNSGIIPLNVKIDQYNNLYGTFGNTDITTESFYRDSQTSFYYGILRGVYDVSDRLKFSAQANYSRSNAWYSANRIVSLINGIQTTFDPTGNVSYPSISSPVDFTNPANFTSPSLGFSLAREIDIEKTTRAQFDWDAGDVAGIEIKARLGGSYVATTKRLAIADGSSIATNRTLSTGGTFSTLNVFSYMNPYVQIGRLANGGNPGYLSEFATFSRSFVMDFLDANGANNAATPNPSSQFTAQEDVSSGWLEVTGKTKLFGRELRADLGLRYSSTATNIDNFKSIASGVFAPNNAKGGYSNWLPSATLAYDLTPKLVARASFGKTITRAALQNIASALYVPNIFSGAYTVGNPNLKPQLATTWDGGVEWYFQPGALLSLGVFQKTLNGTTQAVQDQITLGASGLPASAFNGTALGYPDGNIPADYLLTRTSYINQGTIKLSGLEAAYQQTFKFLPKPFDGLGMLASFTAVKSQGYDFVTQGASPKSFSVAYVPKYTYSITGYYEKGRFSLRSSYNYYSAAANTNVNTGNNQIPYNSAAGYLDANISYRFTDWLEVRVDAVNLTNANTYIYYEDPTGPKGNGQSRRDNSFYNGRTFSFGIRGKF
ncbi:TonB-dependent receptor [Novosphingobium terrae]|uniref:TonB-dependent receptor n=1 Tax=Novosphingobium terrae TaxID=2726189 RepID=UPI00197E4886|nr:TonB-dependent receptor [Novosphingobium terrae]